VLYCDAMPVAEVSLVACSFSKPLKDPQDISLKMTFLVKFWFCELCRVVWEDRMSSTCLQCFRCLDIEGKPELSDAQLQSYKHLTCLQL